MNKTNSIFAIFRNARAGTAALVAAAFLWTNTGGLYAGENAFWEERRSAARQFRGGGDGLMVASLNASPPSPAAQRIASQLPSLERLPLGGATGPSPWKEAQAKKAEDWVRAVLPYGDVGEIYVSPEAGAPTIVHIQDAHGIEEAQRNVAAMLGALKETRGINLAGLEGASGGFTLDPYRAYPADDVKDVADFFLEKGLIAGPEYAGLTLPQPPVLYGVEKSELYLGNVKALKDAYKIRDAVKAKLGRLQSAAEGLKATVYSPALKEYDRHAKAYAEDRETLGAWVRYLYSAQNQSAPPVRRVGTVRPGGSPPLKMKAAGGGGARRVPESDLPNIRLLLDALSWEETLDFKAVEADRLRLVETLVERLSREDLQDLVDKSLAYRSGRMGYGDYHRNLRQVCAHYKVDLNRYGQLSSYITYVLMAEKIEKNELIGELDLLDRTVQSGLAATAEETRLVALSRQLVLTDRLLRHEMTMADWLKFQSARADVLALPDRLAALDGSLSGLAPLTAEELKPFEDFCFMAVSRNMALVENLLAKVSGEGADSAVLVAGGFHTEGLLALLRQKKVSFIVLTPRIKTVPKDSDYLDVLAQDPVPLEKLLAGEKIYLAASPHMADIPYVQNAQVSNGVQKAFKNFAELLAGAIQSFELKIKEIQYRVQHYSAEDKTLRTVVWDVGSNKILATPVVSNPWVTAVMNVTLEPAKRGFKAVASFFQNGQNLAPALAPGSGSVAPGDQSDDVRGNDGTGISFLRTLAGKFGPIKPLAENTALYAGTLAAQLVIPGPLGYLAVGIVFAVFHPDFLQAVAERRWSGFDGAINTFLQRVLFGAASAQFLDAGMLLGRTPQTFGIPAFPAAFLFHWFWNIAAEALKARGIRVILPMNTTDSIPPDVKDDGLFHYEYLEQFLLRFYDRNGPGFTRKQRGSTESLGVIMRWVAYADQAFQGSKQEKYRDAAGLLRNVVWHELHRLKIVSSLPGTDRLRLVLDWTREGGGTAFHDFDFTRDEVMRVIENGALIYENERARRYLGVINDAERPLAERLKVFELLLNARNNAMGKAGQWQELATRLGTAVDKTETTLNETLDYQASLALNPLESLPARMAAYATLLQFQKQILQMGDQRPLLLGVSLPGILDQVVVRLNEAFRELESESEDLFDLLFAYRVMEACQRESEKGGQNPLMGFLQGTKQRLGLKLFQALGIQGWVQRMGEKYVAPGVPENLLPIEERGKVKIIPHQDASGAFLRAIDNLISWIAGHPKSSSASLPKPKEILTPNEDTSLLMTFDGGVQVGAVIDGMGGHASGDKASRIIRDAFNTHFDLNQIGGNSPAHYVQAVLKGAFQAADNILKGERGKSLAQNSNAGAVAAVSVVVPKEAGYDVWVAHLGDARVYVVDPDGGFECVTVDNQFPLEGDAVQTREQMRAARRASRQDDLDAVDSEEAKTKDPELTRKWNTRDQVERAFVANMEDLESTPVITRMTLKAGSRILIVTDGVSDHLTAREIRREVRGPRPAQEVSGRLVSHAMGVFHKRGFRAKREGDDTTAVVIDLPSRSRQQQGFGPGSIVEGLYDFYDVEKAGWFYGLLTIIGMPLTTTLVLYFGVATAAAWTGIAMSFSLGALLLIVFGGLIFAASHPDFWIRFFKKYLSSKDALSVFFRRTAEGALWALIIFIPGFLDFSLLADGALLPWDGAANTGILLSFVSHAMWNLLILLRRWFPPLSETEGYLYEDSNRDQIDSIVKEWVAELKPLTIDKDPALVVVHRALADVYPDSYGLWSRKLGKTPKSEDVINFWLENSDKHLGESVVKSVIPGTSLGPWVLGNEQEINYYSRYFSAFNRETNVRAVLVMPRAFGENARFIVGLSAISRFYLRAIDFNSAIGSLPAGGNVDILSLPYKKSAVPVLVMDHFQVNKFIKGVQDHANKPRWKGATGAAGITKKILGLLGIESTPRAIGWAEGIVVTGILSPVFTVLAAMQMGDISVFWIGAPFFAGLAVSWAITWVVFMAMHLFSGVVGEDGKKEWGPKVSTDATAVAMRAFLPGQLGAAGSIAILAFSGLLWVQVPVLLASFAAGAWLSGRRHSRLNQALVSQVSKEIVKLEEPTSPAWEDEHSFEAVLQRIHDWLVHHSIQARERNNEEYLDSVYRVIAAGALQMNFQKSDFARRSPLEEGQRNDSIKMVREFLSGKLSHKSLIRILSLAGLSQEIYEPVVDSLLHVMEMRVFSFESPANDEAREMRVDGLMTLVEGYKDEKPMLEKIDRILSAAKGEQLSSEATSATPGQLAQKIHEALPGFVSSPQKSDLIFNRLEGAGLKRRDYSLLVSLVFAIVQLKDPVPNSPIAQVTPDAAGNAKRALEPFNGRFSFWAGGVGTIFSPGFRAGDQGPSLDRAIAWGAPTWETVIFFPTLLLLQAGLSLLGVGDPLAAAYLLANLLFGLAHTHVYRYRYDEASQQWKWTLERASLSTRLWLSVRAAVVHSPLLALGPLGLGWQALVGAPLSVFLHALHNVGARGGWWPAMSFPPMSLERGARRGVEARAPPTAWTSNGPVTVLEPPRYDPLKKELSLLVKRGNREPEDWKVPAELLNLREIRNEPYLPAASPDEAVSPVVEFHRDVVTFLKTGFNGQVYLIKPNAHGLLQLATETVLAKTKRGNGWWVPGAFSMAASGRLSNKKVEQALDRQEALRREADFRSNPPQNQSREPAVDPLFHQILAIGFADERLARDVEALVAREDLSRALASGHLSAYVSFSMTTRRTMGLRSPKVLGDWAMENLLLEERRLFFLELLEGLGRAGNVALPDALGKLSESMSLWEPQGLSRFNEDFGRAAVDLFQRMAESEMPVAVGMAGHPQADRFLAPPVKGSRERRFFPDIRNRFAILHDPETYERWRAAYQRAVSIRAEILTLIGQSLFRAPAARDRTLWNLFIAESTNRGSARHMRLQLLETLAWAAKQGNGATPVREEAARELLDRFLDVIAEGDVAIPPVGLAAEAALAGILALNPPVGEDLPMLAEALADPAIDSIALEAPLRWKVFVTLAQHAAAKAKEDPSLARALLQVAGGANAPAQVRAEATSRLVQLMLEGELDQDTRFDLFAALPKNPIFRLALVSSLSEEGRVRLTGLVESEESDDVIRLYGLGLLASSRDPAWIASQAAALEGAAKRAIASFAEDENAVEDLSEDIHWQDERVRVLAVAVWVMLRAIESRAGKGVPLSHEKDLAPIFKGVHIRSGEMNGFHHMLLGLRWNEGDFKTPGEFVLTIAHELGHRLLFSQGFPYDTPDQQAIHEWLADLAAWGLAKALPDQLEGDFPIFHERSRAAALLPGANLEMRPHEAARTTFSRLTQSLPGIAVNAARLFSLERLLLARIGPELKNLSFKTHLLAALRQYALENRWEIKTLAPAQNQTPSTGRPGAILLPTIDELSRAFGIPPLPSAGAVGSTKRALERFGLPSGPAAIGMAEGVVTGVLAPMAAMIPFLIAWAFNAGGLVEFVAALGGMGLSYKVVERAFYGLHLSSGVVQPDGRLVRGDEAAAAAATRTAMKGYWGSLGVLAPVVLALDSLVPGATWIAGALYALGAITAGYLHAAANDRIAQAPYDDFFIHSDKAVENRQAFENAFREGSFALIKDALEARPTVAMEFRLPMALNPQARMNQEAVLGAIDNLTVPNLADLMETMPELAAAMREEAGGGATLSMFQVSNLLTQSLSRENKALAALILHEARKAEANNGQIVLMDSRPDITDEALEEAILRVPGLEGLKNLLGENLLLAGGAMKGVVKEGKIVIAEVFNHTGLNEKAFNSLSIYGASAEEVVTTGLSLEVLFPAVLADLVERMERSLRAIQTTNKSA